MSKKKIIVVDDEPDMTLLLKLELETEGYEVLVANDGKNGLELINNVLPDMVLLDVMLPRLNGYEILKILKAAVATKNIPVILLTAKGLTSEVQAGLDSKADDYIAKPFHAELLVKRIKTILEKDSFSRKNNRSILIIDDDALERRMVVSKFELAGYRVAEALDGDAGLKLAKESLPDLIILDVMLPTMNGFEVLWALQEDPKTKAIPVVLLTIRGMEEDINTGLELGAQGYIVKPAPVDLIFKKVEMILK